MKSRSIMSRSLLALCLSVGVGCKTAQIKMGVDAGGKVLLVAQPGDVIRWIDTSGSGVPVTFLHGNTPCQPNGSPDTCTIGVDSGFYTYKCPNCVDPVIGVGSSVLLAPSTALLTAGAPAIYTDIFCDAKATKADPNPIPANKGDSIRWYGEGLVKNWTVSMDQGICTNGTSFDQGNPVCTLSPSLTSGQSYGYKLSASACTTTPVYAGSIAIH